MQIGLNNNIKIDNLCIEDIIEYKKFLLLKEKY